MEEEKIKISGIIENIIFYNADNDYTVLDLNSQEELITVVGNMPHLSAGEGLTVMGHWVFNQKFGKQFVAEELEQQMPHSGVDILRYLSSGAIKGIGPKTAEKIVARFGEKSLHIIETEPELLADFKGISMQKALEISAFFKSQFGVREIVIKLQKYKISASTAIKIYKKFGNSSVDRILQNPYLLVDKSFGISFETADEIASSIEISDNRKTERIIAGLKHILRHNTLNGHTCLPREKLIKTATAFLEENDDDIDIFIDLACERKELVSHVFDKAVFIFLPKYYKTEKSVAERLLLISKLSENNSEDISAEVKKIEKEENIHYHPLQKEAIHAAVNRGILVLTGGPGTGKTTTLKGIIKILENRGEKISLAAPTGRAAKRMEEVCGLEAKTLHRLLEVSWGENDEQIFQRNSQNKLDCDALIVDEMSMVDINLFAAILDALPVSCKLIMVGDSDQLPSIGAGAVLSDIITSKKVPVIALNTIFRQAENSLIVTNAHRIIEDERPILDAKDNDFFFLKRESVDSTVFTVVDLYCNRLKNSYDYLPVRDIQILCPSRKMAEGSISLNVKLQEILNPPAPYKKEISISPFILREGDKVMQIKNDYNIPFTDDAGKEDCGIFNGDTGILEKIDLQKELFTIRYDDKTAYYDMDSIRNVELSYAITIHKSQGSEYECVVIPLFLTPPLLSYRNLLYTAITRAKTRLIIVGNEDTIYRMSENNSKTLRYTSLEKFIK